MHSSMDTVVKTLRSLLNTTKNGLLEKQLRREFREMEGKDIPYKSLGYSTLLDFLRASGEFDLSTTNEGMNIRARVSQNSQHIVELVGSQNRSASDRRKKSAKSMPFIPRSNPNANRNYSKVCNRKCTYFEDCSPFSTVPSLIHAKITENYRMKTPRIISLFCLN